MTGLINLVIDNFSKLIVLPILALIVIAITIIMDKNSDSKKTKFYPSFILFIVSLALALISYINFTKDLGLNLAWLSLILGSSAVVGILTGLIINIYKGVEEDYEKIGKERKNGKK